jgi:hypothetical protein
MLLFLNSPPEYIVRWKNFKTTKKEKQQQRRDGRYNSIVGVSSMM